MVVDDSGGRYVWAGRSFWWDRVAYDDSGPSPPHAASKNEGRYD